MALTALQTTLIEAAAAAPSAAILATRTSDPSPTPTLLPNSTETTNPSNPEYPQSTDHPGRPYGHRGMASTALIISAVSGALCLLTLLSVAVWCGLRARRRRRCRDRMSEAEIALKQSIGGRDRDSRHPTSRSSSSSEKIEGSFRCQSSYRNHASASSITMMLDGQESSTGSNRSTLLETPSSSVGGKVTYPPKAMTSPKLSTATRGSRFSKSNAVGGTRSTSMPQPSNGQSLLPPPRQQQQQSAHDHTYYPHLHQPQPRQPGKQSPVEGVTPLESFYHDMNNAPASPSSPPTPEQALRVLSSKHAVPLPLPFSSSFSESTSSPSPSKTGPESTRSVATTSLHRKSPSMSSPLMTAATVTSPRSNNAALDWPRVSKEHLPPPPPPPSMPPPAIPEIITDPLTLPESTSSEGPSPPSTVQSPTSPTQVSATPPFTSRKSGRFRSATESSVRPPRSSNPSANRSSNGHSVEAMQQQQPQQRVQGISSEVSVPTSLGQGGGAILTVPARSGPGHRRTKSNILTLDSVTTTPLHAFPPSSPSLTSSLSAFPSPPVTTPLSSSFSLSSRAMGRPQDRKPPVSSVLQPTKSLGPMTVQVPRPTSWHLKAEEGGGLVAVAGGGTGAGAGAGGGAPLHKNIRETVAESRREGVLSPSWK